MEKDNQNNPVDERCLPHRDENCKPRHAWADAVEKRCTPIPEDGAYRSRHLAKESETSVHRPDPIPSDLIQKKSRDPLIDTIEQDLLHGPHHIGETLCQDLVDITADIDVLFLQPLQYHRRQDQDPAVLLHHHLRVKGDLVQNTGGGKHIRLSFVDMIEGDLPALL